MAAGAPLLLATMGILWLFIGVVDERADRSTKGSEVLSGDASDNGVPVLDRSIYRDGDREPDKQMDEQGQ